METRDSRRLTGPNILTRRAGAVLDIGLDEGDDADLLVRSWRQQARRILEAVGWGDQELASRRFHGGLSLWLGAPVDALYAATEVNEWAWEAAVARLEDPSLDSPSLDGLSTDNPSPQPRNAPETDDPPLDLDAAAERLRGVIAAEQNPAVLAMQQAAHQHGVAFLWDDDEISVGMGRGSRNWPAQQTPPPQTVDWSQIHDLPIALVTGTNGKTTSVRLLKCMVEASGRTVGLSSTDGCWVADEEIGEGDYSGPGGARRVLRHPGVEIGLLETARGGMLRRGLAVERADVALITNVAEDHLGEWGVHDLDELVETKLIVAQAAERLVLNADDANLRRRAGQLQQPITWFGLEPQRVAPFVAAGARACVLDDGHLVWLDQDGRQMLIAVDDVPMTFGGAARHNIANALGAVAVAVELGLDMASIRQGLKAFDSSDRANPGRLNRFDLGGVTAIVDFAHNPHGLEALLDMAAALPASRCCVLIGQAGDRDDEAIRELPRLVWRYRPDRVILKELRHYLRGRQEGEVIDLMADELRRLGAPDDVVGRAPSEIEAVRDALRWARDGDLLLLLSHAQRGEVLSLLRHLQAGGWHPGEALPEMAAEASKTEGAAPEADEPPTDA